MENEIIKTDITARTLYKYLQLAQGQFSRWASANIIYNKVFKEQYHWKQFITNIEGNKVKDYYLSSDMIVKIINSCEATTYNIKVNILKQLNLIDTISLVARQEIDFFELLDQILKPIGYNIIKQKSMFNGKYRLDGYIEELNIAIEYDEGHHKQQQSEDIIRQLEIESFLKCTFVRCDYRCEYGFNTGLVIKEIIRKEKLKV